MGIFKFLVRIYLILIFSLQTEELRKEIFNISFMNFKIHKLFFKYVTLLEMINATGENELNFHFNIFY